MPSSSPLHRLHVSCPPFMPPPPSRFFHFPALPRASVVLLVRGTTNPGPPSCTFDPTVDRSSCMVSSGLTSAHPDKNTWTRARYFRKERLHHERVQCREEHVLHFGASVFKVCKNVSLCYALFQVFF